MFRLVRSALAAFDRAQYLSSLAGECRDPDQLREAVLAAIRGPKSGRLVDATTICREEAPPRIAA